MRFVVIIVCIGVGYYIALYLINSLRKQSHRIYQGHQSGYGQSRNREYGAGEGANREERYTLILGITREDGPADIKRKYRDLLAKYHPDKVQHLGVEFQEMAEEKTREILEAYEFFRKKHHI